jgi:hypothetical protein
MKPIEINEFNEIHRFNESPVHTYLSSNQRKLYKINEFMILQNTLPCQIGCPER